jgi:hypothetical protein
MTKRQSYWKRAVELLNVMLFLILTASVVHAGEPLSVLADGTPLKWSATSPVPFSPDGGNLGLWNNTTAVANALEAFNRWGPDISTSALTFSNAGPIPGDGDINTLQEFSARYGNCTDEISPVIFDADGSLFSALGLPSNVIAFSGPECYVPATGTITQGVAAFNGKWLDGNSSNGELTQSQFKGILVHEFGHWLNLGHSQVNGHYFLFDTDPGFVAFGPPPLSSVEVMFPFAIGGATTPRKDDVAAISRLYPAGGFGTITGTITGTIFLPNEVSPFEGADVIARNIVDPYNDAVSNVSGRPYAPPALIGEYELPGLSNNAAYSIEMVNVNPQFTGSSGVGPLDPPQPMPGPEEFYNGVNESSTNPPDDPTVYTSVTSTAGVTTSGINMVINCIPPTSQGWAARYNGSANNQDVAQKVVTDACGNTYVTGWSHNGSNFDYLTEKYGAAGNLMWTARYDNGVGDFSHALAVDTSGNVYVTGRSHTSLANPTFDAVTVKYDPNGNQVWARRYDTAGRDDMGLAVVLDGSGNPIVTGFGHNGTNTDSLTIKYDTNGNLLWAGRYDNQGNDSSRALAVDSLGNVYVTGWSEDSAGIRDYATIKYNAGGVRQWVTRYNGSANNQDVAQSVATDNNGNAVVTGWSHNGSNFDYLTVKYDANGNQLWARPYNNGVGDFGHVVRVDGPGNIYVTGRSHTSSANQTFDVATLKYDPNGNQLWVKRYDRTGRDDLGLALAVDSANNAIVTGSGQNAVNTDYLTIKYDPNGNPMWVNFYENGGDDAGRGTTVDTVGNVYVTGWSTGTGGLRDYTTIKYAP